MPLWPVDVIFAFLTSSGRGDQNKARHLFGNRDVKQPLMDLSARYVSGQAMPPWRNPWPASTTRRRRSFHQTLVVVASVAARTIQERRQAQIREWA